MKFGKNGRLLLACAVSIALMLGMSACGGGTVGYLWVLAQQTSSSTAGNTIFGYKIDDFTGNLTEIVKSPFASGSKGIPVNAVVLPGGRYLYTVNQGEPTNSVALFSVGGDGVLTFQQGFGSTGATPVWMDIGTGYIYVLDRVSPARNAAGVAPACASPTLAANTAPCGSVEVFQISSDGTGNLTPVLNTSIKVNNQGITYFPVGPAPTRLKYTTSGVIVINGDGTITSFGIGGGGQLTTSANSTQVLDSTGQSTITSITSGGSYIYLTDGLNNRIFQYTSSNGVLQPVNGSPYTNLVSNTTPVWTLTSTDSSNNTYLYVLNSGATNSTTATGSISAFSVASDGRLTGLGGLNNQFKTGGFPVCILKDPSNQYLYSSNGDGSITGFQVRQGLGTLTDLRRGSQFKLSSGSATCLVTSGILS